MATGDGRNILERATAEAEDMLTAHPDINVIYATGDPQLQGGLAAAASQGRDIAFFGWDDIPEPFLKPLEDGRIVGFLKQKPEVGGEMAVRLLVRTLDGKEIPKRFTYSPIVVTMYNLDQFRLATAVAGGSRSRAISGNSSDVRSTPRGERQPAAGRVDRRRVALFAVRYGMFLALGLWIAAMSIASEHFLSATNLLNVARQAAPIVIVGVGMTFVMATAGIDLSVGSLVALVSVLSAAGLTCRLAGLGW